MTFNDEFIPGGAAEEEGGGYPTAFGITFTPPIIGGIVAVLGLLGTAFIAINFIQPAFEEYNKKQGELIAKTQEVDNLKKTVQNIEKLQADLVKAEGQRKQVLSLFSTEQNLDTLLLDVNNSVKERRADLKTFQPILAPASGQTAEQQKLAANDPFQRQTFTIALDGNFEQMQTIIRNIERLQILTVVREFNTTVTKEPKIVINQGVASVSGAPILTTTFKLETIIPRTAPPTPAAQPSPSPTPKK
jgi:Tfp pilus assembly protein PilO